MNMVTNQYKLRRKETLELDTRALTCSLALIICKLWGHFRVENEASQLLALSYLRNAPGHKGVLVRNLDLMYIFLFHVVNYLAIK